VWEKTLAYKLNQLRSSSESQEDSICVDYSLMEGKCKEKVNTDGYHNANKVVTDTDSDALAKVIQTLFEARKGNAEYTHWETGTQRLSLYMTQQHFFDLADQSYEEHTTNKERVDTPYKFFETLPVWASELTEDSVDIVLRVIRAASKRVGAQWVQEFEAVMTGTNGDISPQMWHFDGTFACLAAVGVLPCPCAGIEGGVSVRDSTEFVKYTHKRLTDFATDKEKMDYLATVWNRIERLTVKTKKQFDLAKRQDEVKEILTAGNCSVSWATCRGDMTVFLSDHLHRGAASSGIGYAYFCAWEVPQNTVADTHTDGEPVQFTNWKAVYKTAFHKQAKEALAKGILQKNAERTGRRCKRS
jgi:hypothetical protein